MSATVPHIVTGNAAADGAPFRGWFVGDLPAWSGMARGAAQRRFGLRATDALSVKWGVHPAGETRKGGWAKAEPTDTVSILVSGEFVIRFRDAGSPTDAPLTESRLARAGDYAAWDGAVEHTWEAVADSVVVTVRWRVRA
ncbi:MAG: signal peptidase I [Gemmatimonadaceae bacterium]